MLIGSTLGPYEIKRRLSVGGMGEVYLAEDTRLSRKVALKVLPTEWARDSERLERLQREARVLATLNHPNIVTIYSVEKHDGVHFFTMELVEGQLLSEIIPPEGLSVDRLLELAVPLADALAAAHERGVIHRDIKPANIMVRHDGRVKILDFGLAKREADRPPPAETGGKRDEPQTQEGQLLGTVAYMAPEQMVGRPADSRSDLFTLGVVLYEMAFGVRPFEEGPWVEPSFERPMPAAEIGAPEQHGSPDAAAAGRPVPLPGRMVKILRRCLRKDPAARYPNAAELCRDLEALRLDFVSGTFVAPRLELYRKRRWRTWIAAAAAAVVLGLTAGLLISRYTAAPAPSAVPSTMPSTAPSALAMVPVKSAPRIAVLPFENLGPPENEYFAAGISEEISSRLASVRALRVISRSSIMQSLPVPPSDAVAGGEGIGDDLGADYLLEGTVQWSRGADGIRQVRVIPRLVRVDDGSHLWSEIYDRVIDDIFTVQSEIAEAVIGRLDVALLEPERHQVAAARTTDLEAWEAYQRGLDYASQHNPTRENWQLAVSMLERAVRLDPGFALAWAELARAHAFIYRQGIDHSVSRLAHAREAAEKALEIDPDLPDGHRALGYFYYWGHGDYDRALREFQIAAERLPNDSQLLEGMAYIRRRQGRFDEALECFRQAIDLNPRSAWLATELAHTYSYLRRYEEAEEYYARAIRIAPDQPLPYQLAALNLVRHRGDVDGARRILDEMPRQGDTSSLFTRFRIEVMGRHYDAALELLRRMETDIVGLDSALLPKDLSTAFVYSLRGEEERARAHYEAALRLLEIKYRERPDDPRISSALGLAFAGLDRRAEALAAGRRATELHPTSHDAFIGPDYVEHLAVIAARVGDLDLAFELIEQVLARPSGLSRAMLEISPRFDSLREDPRFAELLDEAARLELVRLSSSPGPPA